MVEEESRSEGYPLPQRHLKREMARGVACLVGVCGMAAFGAVEPSAAQTENASHVFHLETGIGLSYFPAYPYEDDKTQYWGINAVGRVISDSGWGLEVGYTYVPQATTTSSSAPRLHVFRAMVVASVSVRQDSPVTINGGLGVAALGLRPQGIGCGDFFPVCAEWAPSRGTRKAAVAEVGSSVHVSRRVSVSGGFRVFRPAGDSWSPWGDPEWITEVSVGFRVLLASWTGPSGS